MSKYPGLRAAISALTGVAFSAYWVIFDPTNDAQPSQFEWRFVIGFSSVLLLLAVAILLYGEMVGSSWVLRLSRVGAAGTAISGVTNVVEDGFGIDWVFFVFVSGTAACLLGLIAITAVIASTSPGRSKLLALVPGATVVAIVAFVAIGGPLMLVAWLAAGVVALRSYDRLAAPVT